MNRFIDSLFSKAREGQRITGISVSTYSDALLFLLLWQFLSNKKSISKEINFKSLDQINNEKSQQTLIRKVREEIISILQEDLFGDILSKDTQKIIPNLHSYWIHKVKSEEWTKNDIKYFFEHVNLFLGSRKAEINTPQDIVKLIQEIVLRNAEEEKSIYDPFCRTGDLLFSVSEQIEVKKIVGITNNQNAYRIARLESFLLGNKASISLGANEYSNADSYDIVVTNPPFGIKDYYLSTNRGRWSNFLNNSTRSEYFFLTHVLDKLSKEGKAIIVMPRQILFGAGSVFELRKALVDENLIESIINLPNEIFHNTAVSTVLIFLNRSRTQDKILLVDAAELGIKIGKKRNLSFEEIATISELVNRFKRGELKDESELYRIVSKEEVVKNDFDLQPSKYKRVKQQEHLKPSAELLLECEQLEVEIREIQREFRK